MARSRSAFRQVHTRRLTAWGLGPGGNTVTALSGTGQTILGAGVVMVSEEKSTIVRVRGSLQAYLKTTAAADDGFHCAVGLALVTDEAFAVGATAVPGPISEIDWDGWMYHRIFDVHATGGTASDTIGLSVAQFEVDSKAMRKWDEGNTLMAVVEVVEGTTATMSVWFDTRILIKLS